MITEPSALVMDVVVEPSLLVTDVLVAPASACSKGSEEEPPAPEPDAPVVELVPSVPVDPSAIGDMVMVVVAALALRPLQCFLHFIEAHRPVAIGVEFVEDIVGLREVGPAGAERAFEFRSRRSGRRHWHRSARTGLSARWSGRWIPDALDADAVEAVASLPLRGNQRAHRLRRDLRKTGTTGDRRQDFLSASSRSPVSNGVGGFWAKPVVCDYVDFDVSQRLQRVHCGRGGAKGKQHGRTPTVAAVRRPALHGIRISKPRATAKNPIKSAVFYARQRSRWPRQLVPPPADFSAP